MDSYCDLFSTVHYFRRAMSATPPAPLTLTRARCGERLRITSICRECPECIRLRELGFCEDCEVRKVSEGGAMICLFKGARVAIGRELGAHVQVERLAA
jgi:Fe2+ transport system protein FeoA